MGEIDLDNLFIARLVVASVGDMNGMKWWDCSGTLGSTGRISVSRGMPNTHGLARARLAFAVAQHRCREVYSRPGVVTLWDLPAPLEASFEEASSQWIGSGSDLVDRLDLLEGMNNAGVLDALERLLPISDSVRTAVKSMRRGGDLNAVPLGECQAVDDDLVLKLAAGFSKGEPGRLAVPFINLEEGA